MVEHNLSGKDISAPFTHTLYEIAKRIADLVVSVLLLILFFPILAVVACWVMFDSPGPIFFRQVRIGKNGIPFKIIKFRTMVLNAESLGPQVTSRNDPRMTRSGGILRSWKLDEFPQFINVLMGDMSLVGPRPQVPKYVEAFPDRQRAKILSVRPGVTGPTAIKFRHEEEMLQNRENREEFYFDVLLPIKCDLDEAYIDSRGFRVDFSALLQTAAMLLRGVFYRLRRIPVGDTIEYPVPDIKRDVPERSSMGFAVTQSRSNASNPDEDDGKLEAALRD